MKMHKKKMLGVFGFLIVLAVFFAYKSFSSVLAAPGEPDPSPPKNCAVSDENQVNLAKYYGVIAEWNEESITVDGREYGPNTVVVITSKHGSFRVSALELNTNYIDAQFTQDGYYYNIDGKPGVVNGNGSYIVLPINKNTPPGTTIKLKMALSETDSGVPHCSSLAALNGDGTGSTYGRIIEIEIPALFNVVLDNVHNPEFANETDLVSDSPCKQLRVTPAGESTPNAEESFYRAKLPYCFNSSVSSAYKRETVSDLVSNIRSVWKTSSDYTATNNHTSNETWTLNFEESKAKALGKSEHSFIFSEKLWFKNVDESKVKEAIGDSYSNYVEDYYQIRCVKGSNGAKDDIYLLTKCTAQWNADHSINSDGSCIYINKNGIDEIATVPRQSLTYLSECTNPAGSAGSATNKIELKCNSKPNKWDSSDPTNPSKNDFTNLYTHYYSYRDENGKELDKRYDNTTENIDLDKYDLVYNIDANVDYYYATEKWTRSYPYPEWDGNNVNGSKMEGAKCDLKCEEVVEVKYGPPAAIKAGLCFEYQIQVTSKVQCNGDVIGDVPTPPNLCSPVPYCNDLSNYMHQAGPTEQYDKCVKSCDGGKYTKKCSDKCYKKVYGKSSKSKASKMAAASVATATLEKTGATVTATCTREEVANRDPKCYAGKYSYNNGTISWNSASGETYARYYFDVEFDRTKNDHLNPSGRYYLPINGFKTHVNSVDGNNYSSACSNVCRFSNSNCPASYKVNGYYFYNEEDIEKYYQSAMDSYKSAISKCTAAAKCTTKTANFTIQASYIDSSDKKEIITFPYSTEPDKLESSETDENVCKNSGMLEAPHILLNFGGCYGGCPNNNEYHAHWSFPGTYRDNKHKTYTYEDKSKDSRWKGIPDKFCVKEDVKNVNTGWWKMFFSHYSDVLI